MKVTRTRYAAAEKVLFLARILAGSAISVALVLTIASFSFAHTVHVFGHAHDKNISTDSYFSDGTKVQDGLIQVYDSRGGKLLEGRTDENGEFDFQLTQEDSLRIVLITRLGHRNSFILTRDGPSDAAETENLEGLDPRNSEIDEHVQIHLSQMKKIIEESLEEKLAPITRQLAKRQQENISLTEIMGGIGYIFGLTGITLYLVTRKRGSNKKNAST